MNEVCIVFAQTCMTDFELELFNCMMLDISQITKEDSSNSSAWKRGLANNL